jgi:hypothetical protein
MKYVLVITDIPKAVPSETRERGFEVRCCLPLFGGTGGKSIWFATKKELKAFADRADVGLDVYCIGPTKFSFDD